MVNVVKLNHVSFVRVIAWTGVSNYHTLDAQHSAHVRGCERFGLKCVWVSRLHTYGLSVCVFVKCIVCACVRRVVCTQVFVCVR